MGLSKRGNDDACPAEGAAGTQAVAPQAVPLQEESTGGGGSGSRHGTGGALAVEASSSNSFPRAVTCADSNGLSSSVFDSSGLVKPLESKPSTASEAGSEASSGVHSSELSPHYDAVRDVILRLEFLRTPEFKAIIRSVAASVIVGVVILIIALYMKVDKPDSHYLEDNTVSIVNLAFAGMLCPALVAACGTFFYRVYRSNLSGKRWSHRRRRAATLSGIEISLQLINCIFFIVPNAWVLTYECTWFDPLVLWSGFVRWTIWNTLFLMFVIQAHSANPANTRRWRKYVTRADSAVMDAPLYAHWPKFIMWVALEGILVALTVVIQTQPSETAWDPAITDCRQQIWNCHFSDAGLTLLVLNVSCVIMYFLLWVFFITRAFNNLQHLPYNSMRMANLTTRIQVKLRGLSITFFVLCIVCYSFVKLNTCSSYIISWLGFLPMQVVMSATAIANCYMCMPKRPRQAGVLQVWLQEFAWLERDVPAKKEERASSLPPDSYEGFCLDCEPLWCFETAVKMMYWSFLVYDYQEEKGGGLSPYSPDTALLLYELEHWECMWERSLDTKAIVGWNSDTVVIAFRGTASMANVKSDLQAWRTRWPAGVGSVLTRTAPMVHQGFHACYTASGFNDKLLSRLEHILYRCASEQKSSGSDKPVTVYVTGHSLGGALATLCAYDIKKRCPCAEYLISVKCYTFGAPRVGNHAFVRLYNEAVPDTWHIINNEDVITKAGKFWVLYKRGGHRVLINKLGDLVVRPNYVETAIRGVPGGASVRDHLLTQYQKALMAVVASQFGSKSFVHGKDGVLSLTQQRGIGDVLHTAGLTVKELRVLRERGWDAYQSLTRHEAAKTRRVKTPRLRRGGSKPVQLKAVVVAEEESVPEQPAAAAAAAAPAAGDLEAGATAPPVVTEEQDGVLHTTQMNCRIRCGRRAQTICSLMRRQPARAAAASALSAAPEADAPATSLREQHAAAQLQAVAEEEGVEGMEEGDSPPSTPSTPSSQQHDQRQGWWWRQRKQMASALGWATHSLSSSSAVPSLASSSMSSLSPTASNNNTRGSMGDAPTFPLVLDLGTSDGEAHPSGLPTMA